MTQYKMENGQRVPLTAQEQADYDAQQTAWAAGTSDRAAAIAAQIAADPLTQIAHLTAALVSNNVISSDNLPAPMITSVNATLTALGSSEIAIPVVVKPANIIKPGS